MAKEPTLIDLTSQYSTQSTLNSNWDAIQAAFQNTLSLDGSSPNAMLADLDLNNNDLLNAKTINTTSLFINGALITSTSATPAWRGAWVTSTAYALNDIVESGGSAYIATVAHTSGTFATDLSGGKWELFVSKGDGGTGDLVAANDLSDLNSAGTALINLGLTATAAEINNLDGITAAGAALLDDADATAQRATLGLGDLALVDAADLVESQADWNAGVATQESTITAAKLKEAVETHSSILTLETAQTTTTGTEFDFTSIPAGVNEITVMFDGVSTNGTNDLLIQIGDSGGPEVSGYQSSSTHGAGNSASTSGFNIIRTLAGDVVSGSMKITRMNGNRWVQQHGTTRNTSGSASIGGGSKTLSGELTQVRITRSGADTFDAGAVNISYR